MSLGTFKEWPFYCMACDEPFKHLAWGNQLGQPAHCPKCSSEGYYNPHLKMGKAPGLITDDIPGGMEIRHGLVQEDGSPKKFYSKTDIKRAANEAGLNWADDSPGPYKVNWSGVKKAPEKVDPIA
jgi:hypothetical protein